MIGAFILVALLATIAWWAVVSWRDISRELDLLSDALKRRAALTEEDNE